MTNRLRSFLSRLALPLILLSPTLALADTITTFDVSGPATNISGGSLGSCASGASCPYAGTLTVDVTAGTVDGASISFPGLTPFVFVSFSEPELTDWTITVESSENTLGLLFTTTTPSSLVDFDGGTILTGLVTVTAFPTQGLYNIESGTITPVPEPSSLVPLAGGLVWLVFGLARRRVRG
jgi:hypothetical protein